ncbi:general substrate transporter [Hortaea werneckii]|nr:general substrate transporter [Hortaea werneckii]KAI7014098.1 general substrate transporter [Hortaea werneckii]KAI7204504.1 general substrate transporter [Hortaea werneckii]KAI7665735.1 general substrate transporter [Hortaea werneckii]
MVALEGELYRPAFPSLTHLENPAYVSSGADFDRACAYHVNHTLGVYRVYIVASRSLSQNTGNVHRLEQALGDNHVATWPGFSPHTPWNEVLDATKDAKQKKADCIVTIGGGSLTDGAKAMLLLLANDITTLEQLREFQARAADTQKKLLSSGTNVQSIPSKDIPCVCPTIPLICIPTTLSGGEYSHFAGGTDPETGHKSIFGHPFCGPRLIIDDAKLTTTSPEWVWLSTGVRGIDHCVEAFCRSQPEDTEMDREALEAFTCLVPGLLRTKKNWNDEQARLGCMLGVNRVMIMLKKGIMPGASHGIGHQLGPMGVGHGETSCILLPAVLKYNARVNAKKQERMKAALWDEPSVSSVLEQRGLTKSSSDLADALDAVLRELGMPRSLKEKGVGEDRLLEYLQYGASQAASDAKVNPVEGRYTICFVMWLRYTECDPRYSAEYKRPMVARSMFGVKLRGKALTAVILACAGLDFLEFGYDQGLLGGILSGDRFREMLGEPDPTMEGLLSGIYTVGCAGGALVSFIWGEKMGRVGSILWANVIVIIGAVIQTACYSYWQMFVARIIAGIGVGLSTVSVPILQSETLPARNRGAMLVIQSALINAGVAIASWLTFATLFSNSSLQWRFPIAMQVFFSAIVLVLCFFIPETPRWLVSRGRHDEARTVIAQLADTTEDDTLVEGQLQEILDNVKEENLNETSWSDTFHNKTPMRNLHRVVLGMGPYMMNQWSGINSITYYLTYTLQNYLGFERNLALILASVSFTQYAILSWPPYFYIDKIGRRWTIMLSSAGCSVCLVIVAACLLDPTDARSAAAVAFMFLFTDAFTLGILPVSWSYSSEIQPLSTRNKATSVGVASHWLSNFVVVLVTPIGLDNIGTNYYWIWAGVNALFVPLVFFFGVETAGRSLEMVDQDFIEEPRVLMGLNPRHRKVLRATKEDEEQRFRRSSLTGAEKVDEGTEKVEAVS